MYFVHRVTAYRTMQANCRSSLKQKKSSSGMRGRTDSPPDFGDGKLEGLRHWEVLHVSPHWGVHLCMLVMACI